MSYQSRFQAAFGVAAPLQHLWCNATFEYQSDESFEVLQGMYNAEMLACRKLLTEIKDTGIQGAICEFGVSGGNTLLDLLTICEEIELVRPFYGFDSFEGLPAPGQFDADCWHEGDYAADFAEICEYLETARRPNLHLVKGWFDEAVRRPEIAAIERVCYARIDSDLYESAVTALAWLDGRLADGAILCFDDWIPQEGYGEAKAFFEWAERVGGRYRFEFLFLVSLGHVYIRVRHAPTPE